MKRITYCAVGLVWTFGYGCKGTSENNSATDSSRVTTISPTSSESSGSEVTVGEATESTSEAATTDMTEGSDSTTGTVTDSQSTSDGTSESLTDTSDTVDTTESTEGSSTDPSETGTSDGASGSESSSTTGFDVKPCEEVQSEVAEPPPPNVMLVLDKSGSMTTDISGNSGVSRWEALHEVISMLLENTESQVAYGLQLYPSKFATNDVDSACLTLSTPEVGVSLNNKNLILDESGGMPGEGVPLEGGTPASLGLESAIDHLVALDPAIPRAIVLVTDGAANCDKNAENAFERLEVYDDSVHAVVADAYINDLITTYVVGIDIINDESSNEIDGNPNATNSYLKLNQLAIEGGAPKAGETKFYDSQSQGELETAITEISESLKTCELTFTEPPEPDLTELEINGQVVPHVSDCESEDGWVYMHPDGPYAEVELCGTFCDLLKEEGEANMKYFCTIE